MLGQGNTQDFKGTRKSLVRAHWGVDLQDTQYRTALAWQNTAYNQPPHPSFHIGSGMTTAPRPTVATP
jgi:hypothetical protein